MVSQKDEDLEGLSSIRRDVEDRWYSMRLGTARFSVLEDEQVTAVPEALRIGEKEGLLLHR